MVLGFEKNCSFYSITNSLHSLCDSFGDHQVYVCLLETNVPVRIKEESCENQRWNPVDDFCYRLLPTDRANFFSCRWPWEQRSSQYHTTKEGLDLGCWMAVKTSRWRATFMSRGKLVVLKHSTI
jgi:hypothetical protein